MRRDTEVLQEKAELFKQLRDIMLALLDAESTALDGAKVICRIKAYKGQRTASIERVLELRSDAALQQLGEAITAEVDYIEGKLSL